MTEATETTRRAVRAAVVRLDAGELARATDAARRAAERSGDAAMRQIASHAELWLLWSRGEIASLTDRALALETEASRARRADLVIDAAALAALAALAQGDLARALSIARRASRMARTEAMPEEEYLANVVLARVRRHSGRPYLTTRIVLALSRAAPPLWQGWLALELELAGASDVAARVRSRAEACAAASIGASVAALFASATRGDRPGFNAATHAASDAIGGHASLRAELDALVRALDPLADPGPSDALGRFLRGEASELPGWLAGPAQVAAAGEAHAPTRALAMPDRTPRRVLALGLPLASGALVVGREAGARQERRETALAILALAGPDGIAKEDLFRAIWGFAFTQHLHQGVLDVLLHRARAALGDAGDLVRREGRVALVLARPIAVADPRAERSLDDRVLALVSARGGGARARELAQDLDVPLRTVQGALGRLVESGDCLREGEGQGVIYRVEDTTFREPTEG